MTGGPVMAIGAFPPPVTGQSESLETIARDLDARGIEVIRVDVSARSIRRSTVGILRRGLLYLIALKRIAAFTPRSGRKIYLVCEGGPGLAFTCAVLAVARAFRTPVVLQHHTFAYVAERKPLMALANRLLGPRGCHVFLSPGMAAAFSELYVPARPHLVNHNLAQLAGHWRALRRMGRRRPGERLKVGFLSNLMAEKGFDTFLDVARALPECDFVLAGAPAGAGEARLLAAGQRDLGQRLDVRGRVHGADKLRFFREIDIFLFPTRYAYEAQPLVILEACAAGVYVLTARCGCIGEDIDRIGGQALDPRDAQNTQAWCAALRALDRDRAGLTRARASVLRNTRRALRDAEAGYAALVSRLS